MGFNSAFKGLNSGAQWWVEYEWRRQRLGKSNADGGKDSVYILTITQHWRVGDDV